MSNTPNFQSILDESPDHIEYRPPIPTGTYVCVVGQPRYDKSSKKGTEFVEFILRPIEALEDVDTDDLEEAGGLDGVNLRATFYETNGDLLAFGKEKIDEFHQNCGINLKDRVSRRMRNDMVINTQVLAVITHQQSDDGRRTFARINRTAPVE